MDRIKALREQIADLLDEAQSLNNIADSEQRAFTDEETSRWDAIMHEETGQLVKLQVELDTLEKRETEKKRLAAQRRAANRSVFDNELTPSEQPAPRINLVRAPLQAFKNTDAGRLAAHESGLWLRAAVATKFGYRDEQAQDFVQNRFGGIRMTHTEGTNSAGGYTVPDPLSAAFIEYREQVGVARQICDVRPMTSDTLSIPKLVSGNTVTYPGEATAITANDQTWGQIALTAVKRAVLTKVSNELAADTVINLVDQLVSRLAHEFARQEDNELINGDGTATYGGENGLLNRLGAAGLNTAPSGDDTWGELAMVDFVNTMSKLPAKYGSDLSWVCSRPFYFGVMLRVLAEAGGNTVQSIEAGAGMNSFLGYPVFLTDKMPTATAVSTKSVLFGAFREAVVIGDRETLSIGFSDQRYFDEDVLAVRATSRYDINVHEPGDGSNAGAYVGLATAAS